MALIKCPECKKKISDKAETCQFCGCPNSLFTEENENVKLYEDNVQSVKEKLKKFGLPAIILVVIIVIVFCIVVGKNKVDNNENGELSEDDTQEENLDNSRLEEFMQDTQGYWYDNYRKIEINGNKTCYSIKEDVTDDWPEFSEFIDTTPYIDDEDFCRLDVKDEYGNLVASLKYKEGYGNLDSKKTDWMFEYSNGIIMYSPKHETYEDVAEEEEFMKEIEEEEEEEEKLQDSFSDDENYKTSIKMTDGMYRFDQYEFIMPDGWTWDDDDEKVALSNDENNALIMFFSQEVDYEGSVTDSNNKEAYLSEIPVDDDVSDIKDIIIGDNIKAIQFNSIMTMDNGTIYEVVNTLFDGEDGVITLYYAHPQNEDDDGYDDYKNILDTMMIQIPRYRRIYEISKAEMEGVTYYYPDKWDVSGISGGRQYEYMNNYFSLVYYEYQDDLKTFGDIKDTIMNQFLDDKYEISNEIETTVNGKNAQAFNVKYSNVNMIFTFIDLEGGCLEVDFLGRTTSDTEDYYALLRSLVFSE